MDAGQGVYQLFLDARIMYIGKADKNLRARLERHYRMLAARQNIDTEKLGFKALFIHKNWTTWTTEAALIRFFGEESPWNASGLGSNDPGHNREDTAEEDTFNSLYPIDPNYVCDWISSGEYVLYLMGHEGIAAEARGRVQALEIARQDWEQLESEGVPVEAVGRLVMKPWSWQVGA